MQRAEEMWKIEIPEAVGPIKAHQLSVWNPCGRNQRQPASREGWVSRVTALLKRQGFVAIYAPCGVGLSTHGSNADQGESEDETCKRYVMTFPRNRDTFF